MRQFRAVIGSATELAKFRRRLLGWFRKHKRDLPWRRTRDPYRVWLSEIMLQQTRVTAVMPYYDRFLARFPDLESLANAPVEEVLRLWAGLGYYSRARNLLRAAQAIVSQHGGVFPKRLEAALALPGVGRYTAAAILSIAYDAPCAVLDGNVARVLARLGAIRGDLKESKRARQLQEEAQRLLDARAPGDWNQAMMELGATVCTPRAPKCGECPVAPGCRARKLGLTEKIPARKKKHASVKIQIGAAILLDARRRTLLLAPAGRPGRSRRASSNLDALFSRMWHFPAVPVRRNAAVELRDHLASLCGSGALDGRKLVPLRAARHGVTFYEITLRPFLVRLARLPRMRGARVIPLVELERVPVSSATRKIAAAVPRD